MVRAGFESRKPSINIFIYMESIEKKVTDAILQRASTSIEIEGKTYPIAPATPATLILVSELVADMPSINTESENIFLETLHAAKDCSVIGDIVATLILGAKRINENNIVTVPQRYRTLRFSWKKMRWVHEYKTVQKEMTELSYLSKLILENCSPSVISEVISKRLIDMGISDFFGLTTSLSAANLIKRTREVE